MDIGTLRGIKLPNEIDVCRDEILTDRKSGQAFAYPNGKSMPHTSFYRLIRQTCQKVVGRPMSQEKFREYINQ